MGNPVKFDESGDSEDLQALFDSIAASTGVKAPPPAPEMSSSGDSDELQALFDSVVAHVEAPAAGAPSRAADASLAGTKDDIVFNRLGHMARQLHDTLRELGYDKLLEDTARQVPDARQRLTYIAQMTEQAASRVLNATDIAKPLQEGVQSAATTLGIRWDKMFANQLSVEEFKALAADTRDFFSQTPNQMKTVGDQLMEIMMAQDFQDLTGQVIKKVVEMAQGLETQLLSVLVEAMPEERKATAPDGFLNGPVISGANRTDVVTTQSQVDDLLESLGF
ncbi:protein phosphatase CheZ [Denitratisoma sp. DHT3]|uniref:protein phosphatase CheZ n=1 Tax=Denitratisoma sp. DHT3 TaxID=1981880 RepID=UPI001198C325|nr:protein phosphatase CheZ [Denitratisoma sp. DHT3]QDX81378.1 protein phosphatase CheZ [Denitratisoma sp. DHT3]